MQTNLDAFFSTTIKNSDKQEDEKPLDLEDFLEECNIPFTKFTSTTFGSHLSNCKGYLSAVERAKKLDFNCLQIFFDNGFGTKKFDISDAKKAKQYIEKNAIQLFVHSPYIINLCRPLSDTYVVELLIKNLEYSHIIGAKGCVVHVGKLNTTSGKISKEAGFQNFKNNVDYVIKKFIETFPNSTTKLLIETAAGQGSEYPTTVKELGELYDTFDDESKKHIGFCVDTCHVFAAGCCDLRNCGGIQSFVREWNQHIGWDKVCLIHFNDSKCDFQSKKDRHAPMGQGFIGKNTLLYFKRLCVLTNKPMVLEYDYRKHDFSEQ